METINASHFKTHFGEILNMASANPVIVKRRGQPTTVLMSEEAYQKLTQQAFKAQSSNRAKALQRLQLWVESPVELKSISDDERAEAIIAKHGKHWNES